MKGTDASILNILFLTLTLLVEVPAWAQPEVTTTPRAITINATRGETVTRTLALRANDSITNLKAIALDALSADNSVVLPATAIQVAAPATPIKANDVISVPITLTLQAVPSGEFTGEIWLTYDPGTEKSIPVMIRVKDPYPLPLLTLLLGLAIGMAVSAYSSQGKLSDEVTIRLENLRTQIDADQLEARSFWSRADMHLTLARQARDAKQVAEAQTALESAKVTWHKWVSQRPNWLIQFRYCDRLHQRLEEPDLKKTPALYIQAIARDLAELLQTAPDWSGPKELQQSLDQLSQQLNWFIQTRTQLEKLSDRVASLEGDQRYDWEDTAADLTQRLYTLLPAQDTEAQALQTDIKTGIEKLRELGTQTLNLIKGIDDSHSPGLVIHSPFIPDQTTVKKPHLWQAISSLWQTANGRLRLFYLSSYLISFTVLAGGGFNQLYWAKPTFGANGWADYFALLALGFGAEAARNVVTQVAQNADETK